MNDADFFARLGCFAMKSALTALIVAGSVATAWITWHVMEWLAE